MPIMEKLQHTISVIKEYYSQTPEVGVVLGSGLGNFKAQMQVECEIPYEDIPHFPVSTVEGHRGTLIFGKMSGKNVVCMAGRFHYYEGYSPLEVAFPVRILRLLGIKTLLLSNAAGGMNPAFKVGDIMVIRDHISLFQPNPLVGPNLPQLGPRFPDMSQPYCQQLISKAVSIAATQGLHLHQGVYAGVTGPTFETPAEYNMLHLLGADAVGMSTVQEVIVARHMGLPVLALSVITDLGVPEQQHTITHQQVLEAAAAAEPKMTTIFHQLIAQL